MADEENVETAAETTEAQNSTQTDTADQFGNLQKELEETRRALEETRKAQSGSDKAVQELRRQLAQKEEEQQKKDMSDKEKVELVMQKQAEWEKKATQAERKAQVMEALTQANVKPPSRIDKLIGETDEETDELIKDHIDYVQAIKQEGNLEFAKANGRKPRSANKLETMTFDDLNEMNRKEVEAFAKEHPDVFDRLTGR